MGDQWTYCVFVSAYKRLTESGCRPSITVGKQNGTPDPRLANDQQGVVVFDRW